MALKRVRIADTEAIAQYYPRYKENVHIVQIVTLSSGKFSRRKISLYRGGIDQLEAMITEELESNAKPRDIAA